MAPEQGITRLLEQAAGGDPEASRHVFTVLYAELRRLAAAQRARIRPGETLNTTAVVHEAFLRLIGRQDLSWNSRHHFFCTAARSMRDILVDEARRAGARKRGGDRRRVDLDDVLETVGTTPDGMIDLDRALIALEREHPDDHEVVMLRYFTGLSVPEIAEVQQVSERTVARRWRFSRAWLARALGPADA